MRSWENKLDSNRAHFRNLSHILILLFFFSFFSSSSSRILAESQNHLVRRSQGLGRHKRKNATEEGRATHAGERGETRDKAAASCGRQAGPQHATTAIVSPTYIQSRYAFQVTRRFLNVKRNGEKASDASLCPAIP